MDHGWTSRPSNKGDYTNHSSRYTQGLKCLRYTHYSEQKTLCPLRARGGGQDLNGQNALSDTNISLQWSLINIEEKVSSMCHACTDLDTWIIKEWVYYTSTK